MKIEQVSCSQFAGLQDCTVSFTDGVNVLFGENETGKSTVVDLIYHLLYHDIDAKQSEKSEKEFQAHYYPKGIGVQGDYADGNLRFSVDDAEYSLEKCWGANAHARLTTPQNIRIQSQDSIDETLADLLQYRKGLYDDVVFAPQRKQEEMVAHIFQSVSGAKKSTVKDAINAKADLVTIIAQEAIRNAGVDANDFERRLLEILNSYNGCWDTRKDAPKQSSLRTKKAGGKPTNEGILFQKYYLVEELKQLAADARKAEIAVDRNMRDLREQQKKLDAADGKIEAFRVYSTQLSQYNANVQLIKQYKDEIKRAREAAKSYPGLLRASAKAVKLRTEFREVEALDLYEDLEAKYNNYVEWNKKLQILVPITDEDIKKAERLEERLRYINQERFNFDILAQLKNTGWVDIEVRSAVDGRVLNVIPAGAHEVEEIDITEPVEICIPGVLSVKLSNHVNGFNKTTYSLDSCSKELDRIYRGFSIYVKNIGSLRSKKEEYDKINNECKRLRMIFKAALGDRDWQIMQQTYQNLSRRKKRRPIAEINDEIHKMCGEKSIEEYCGELSQAIGQIQTYYGDKLHEINADPLKEYAASMQENLKEAEEAVNRVEKIPSQYRQVKDVNAYSKALKDERDAIQLRVDGIEEQMRENQQHLGKKTAEEYFADLEQAKEDYKKAHETYLHWVHILDVFRSEREKTGGNAEMQDVERRFAEYLSIITGGRVSLQSMSNNMDVSITSKNSQLDESILSEGTKDTVALAFRLAMMEHIFPQGGGLLVLDDPFTDMDSERTTQACTLVKRFAQKGNQVIFTTCNPNTAKLIGGNLITF